MKRCINLDWLEVYCLEDPTGGVKDANFFRQQWYDVDERAYGTRVFQEMFTIKDRMGLPLFEIRRNPVSQKRDGSRAFLEPRACHVRLTNRTCYYDNAVQLLCDFLRQYNYTFMRIKRVDIALDFERFDSGDDPGNFVKRYLRGRYSKVNQANIAAHGKDEWEERQWNSLSWGSHRSMVSTKLYNKTLEIREVKDKPYIRQAWAVCGLVDDMMTLRKRRPDGSEYEPTIWRLEFSLTSSVKNWVVLEDCNGDRRRLRSKRNTLDMYANREALLTVFESLVMHYFHFKHFERDKRKDRCQDKTLFRFDLPSEFYKVDHVSTSRQAPSSLVRLVRRLQEYRAICYEQATVKVIDDLLSILQEKQLRLQLADPYNDSELKALRLLVHYRLNLHVDEPLNDTKDYIHSLLAFEDDIF